MTPLFSFKPRPSGPSDPSTNSPTPETPQSPPEMMGFPGFGDISGTVALAHEVLQNVLDHGIEIAVGDTRIFIRVLRS